MYIHIYGIMYIHMVTYVSAKYASCMYVCTHVHTYTLHNVTTLHDTS